MMSIKAVARPKLSVAVDCILFGFDGADLKLLLIQRGFNPERNKWSLMGGFVDVKESVDDAANRILHSLTGLQGIYMEQLQTFGNVHRDPTERTISIAYFALIDINEYNQQLSDDYHAAWFPIDEVPKLIFDHEMMVEEAKKKLRYKAALHPILFELLPDKFTLPQIQSMYDAIYNANFDKRNFSRKLLATGLLIKLDEKDKSGSKKGAYYYQLNEARYKENFYRIASSIINPAYLIF